MTVVNTEIKFPTHLRAGDFAIIDGMVVEVTSVEYKPVDQAVYLKYRYHLHGNELSGASLISAYKAVRTLEVS
ncbi:hypothetical protein [Mycobacterium phage SWU1]|uniref:Gene 83 protein n=2 Tax=Fromanvirus TaxID=186764 RepID=VG83_BPML5|nr:Hypothetical Protein PBI_L5_83 [Fromanvirus L5]YP_006383008.1 hypothetical protein A321_gp08 [Mycobacterium phage SWU1]Q05300.1 RecName: Full=Gene 83 protein; AltName: Full=Gp83 [Fromanvirus L5]AFI24998.1 hypothetical protein [Mycobacterium phage SWU1]CAA79459.1 Hypothetical Protein PBI_L5_83 [Fromanvirus L5]